MTEEQRKEEREAREAERQRVLEAAGLIITKSDRKPPPRPARRRSTRKRRPVPAVPTRHERGSSSASKELPPPPEDSKDTSLRLDDAYERYEAYKQSNGNLNRLSIVSVDSTTSMPSPSPSFAMQSSPSVASSEQEGRTASHFLHSLLGRRTPGTEAETRTRPVISGPILQEKEPGTPSTSAEGGFGVVRSRLNVPTQSLICFCSLGVVW